jgi:hypothetical protein
VVVRMYGGKCGAGSVLWCLSHLMCGVRGSAVGRACVYSAARVGAVVVW